MDNTAHFPVSLCDQRWQTLPILDICERYEHFTAKQTAVYTTIFENSKTYNTTLAEAAARILVK